MEKRANKKSKALLRSKESSFTAILIALLTSTLAYYQNKYGQFSDVRGFYQMHFSDGLHHWPFSNHTLTGTNQVQHPVEYPALTGLVMWLISFFVQPTQSAWHNYFQITATFHTILFCFVAFIIAKATKQKYAIIFAICPAVLYSLNRNWDIWSIPTMLLAIIAYDEKRYKASAFFLAISTATKFFPVILLFPIFIQLVKERRFKLFVQYSVNFFSCWALVNIPFMLINFEGWAYFYKFNFERGLGSASIWDIASKLHLAIPGESSTYLALNLTIFLFLGVFLYRRKTSFLLTESAYLTMFVLFLFNKQYSMQYIIWLTSLCILAVYSIKDKIASNILLIVGAVWQLTEIIFQYSFFQNILTVSYPDVLSGLKVSNEMYGIAGVMRYFCAIFFCTLMARYLHKSNMGLTKKLSRI